MVDTQDIWHKKSRGGFVSENPLSLAQPRVANPLSLARPHASATSTTKPQPAHPRASTVSLRRGDTLWEVAQKKLGNGTHWRELHKVDGSRFTGQEARHLQVGTQVRLPGAKMTTETPHFDTSLSNKSNFYAQLLPVKNITGRELTASSTPSTRSTHFGASSALFSRTSQVSSQVFSAETRPEYINGFSHQRRNTQSESSSGSINNDLNQISSVTKGIALGNFVVNRKLVVSKKLSPIPTEASRAAKPLVLTSTLPDGSNSIKEIPLKRVRYTQASVSPDMKISKVVDGKILKEKISLSQAAENMRDRGWDYTQEPPDVVERRRTISIGKKKIPVGRSEYATLDHRRLVAAEAAGLKKVPARVHSEHDLIHASTDKKFPERRYSRRNPLKGQPRPNVPSTPGSAGFKEAERFRLEKGATYTDPETRAVHSDKEPHPNNWGEAAKHRAANQRVIKEGGDKNFPLTGTRESPKIGTSEKPDQLEKAALDKVLKSTKSTLSDYTRRAVTGTARGASKILAPVAVGLDALQLGSAYQKDGFGQEFRKTAGSVAGGWGGAAAGAAGGAAIGSVVPVVGTAAGAIVGGAIGGFAGSEFGDDMEQGAEKAGKAIVEGGKKLLDKLNPFG